MAVHKKFNTLGRGLDALISTDAVRTQGSSTINEIAIEQIQANPNQPRREFDEEALQDLAHSIKEIGIIQPITLRQISDNRFEIIAGERRWRASQLAGLKAIPAYIRTIKDENVMEMALVENIQREDLNAIEIALAYEHLLEGSGMTQEKELDMGHARALLSIDSPSLQIKVFKEIQKHNYSVRKVEELAQALKNGEDIDSGKKKIVAKNQLPEPLNEAKKMLINCLNAKVQMSYSAKGKGKISIPFANDDDLKRLLSIFEQLKGKE